MPFCGDFIFAKFRDNKPSRKFSNLQYFYSISESSAETEPAWKKAGDSPGLQIWRIVVNMFYLFM